MNKPIYTTLNKIRKHTPCKDGWDKLLKTLGKTKADDEPLKFSEILESNGLDDALWCLRSICPEHEKEVRLFAADCAERVIHIYEEKHNDGRPRKAIEAVRAFADSEIIEEQLSAARAAAGDAARAAAGDAAWAAAGDAAWAAARAAAGDAAGAAAGDAAWAAARAAARDARAAARDAARAAVRAAVRDAARDAARAARDAAGDAEKEIQSKMLIERFG